MGEKQEPFDGGAANDQRDWDIEVKDGEAWLVGPGFMKNLGPKAAAFERMVEVMAAEDFGER